MRRAQAERDSADAELRSLAAQQAAPLAAAEAEGARRQAEQEAARARMAELAAQFDELEAYERSLKEQEERRKRERQQQLSAQLDELDAWKPPTPRMSAQELAALRAQLDREIEQDDRAYAMREEQRQRAEIDREWWRRQARTLAALREERDRQQRES